MITSSNIFPETSGRKVSDGTTLKNRKNYQKYNHLHDCTLSFHLFLLLSMKSYHYHDKLDKFIQGINNKDPVHGKKYIVFIMDDIYHSLLS